MSVIQQCFYDFALMVIFEKQNVQALQRPICIATIIGVAERAEAE